MLRIIQFLFVVFLGSLLTSCGPFYGDALGGSNMVFLVTKADTIKTRVKHSAAVELVQPNRYGKEDTNAAIGLNYNLDYKTEGLLCGVGLNLNMGQYEFKSFRSGFGIENDRLDQYVSLGVQAKIGFLKRITPKINLEILSANLAVNSSSGSYFDFRQSFQYLNPTSGGTSLLFINTFLASGADFMLGKNWVGARLFLGTEFPGTFRNKFGAQLNFQTKRFLFFGQTEIARPSNKPIFPLLSSGPSNKVSSAKMGLRYYFK